MDDDKQETLFQQSLRNNGNIINVMLEVRKAYAQQFGEDCPLDTSFVNLYVCLELRQPLRELYMRKALSRSQVQEVPTLERWMNSFILTLKWFSNSLTCRVYSKTLSLPSKAWTRRHRVWLTRYTYGGFSTREKELASSPGMSSSAEKHGNELIKTNPGLDN